MNLTELKNLLATIDKRLALYLTLDTETCNMVDDNQLPYNIGLVLHDKYENVYFKINIVISEIFYGLKDLCFNSNYYANKMPLYYEALENGEMVVMNTYQIRKLIKTIYENCNVKAVIAHNARFDDRALKNLIRYTTKSKYRYFLPYGLEFWDSQKMAHDTLCKQKSYIKFCEENGFMKKNNKPREKAETLYRYIIDDPTYTEEHIGLQDCLIEMVITCNCLKQHKHMTKKLWNN